eukprot:scaffold20708_cov33-Phaeocystis_antarctica.AAC.1
MRRAPSLCGVRRSLSSSTRASSAGPRARRSGDIAVADPHRPSSWRRRRSNDGNLVKLLLSLSLS